MRSLKLNLNRIKTEGDINEDYEQTDDMDDLFRVGTRNIEMIQSKKERERSRSREKKKHKKHKK